MKNKQSYLTKGSFALLLFVMLGYMVKFYPEQLTSFDTPIQTWLRGDLPAALTTFFKLVTSVIDPMGIIIWVSALLLFFLYKKWKLEAALLAGNLVLHGILIKLIKLLYQRSRPSLSHLVRGWLLFSERACHGDSRCCWDLDYHCPATNSKPKNQAIGTRFALALYLHDYGFQSLSGSALPDRCNRRSLDGLCHPQY